MLKNVAHGIAVKTGTNPTVTTNNFQKAGVCFVLLPHLLLLIAVSKEYICSAISDISLFHYFPVSNSSLN